MKRIILLFTVAAMMALILSLSAGPASALVIVGDNDNGHKFNNGHKISNVGDGLLVFRGGDNHDDDDDFFGFDDDDDFFGFDGDGEVSLGLGDTENDSGDIELENSFSVEGNNNNACLGQQQFGQTGNFTNQQGALQFGGGVDDFNRNHLGDRDGFVIVSDDDDDDFFGFDDDDDFFGFDGDRGFFFGDGNNNTGDLEFSGPEVTFAPENETSCEQDVEQAAAASSFWWPGL